MSVLTFNFEYIKFYTTYPNKTIFSTLTLQPHWLTLLLELMLFTQLFRLICMLNEHLRFPNTGRRLLAL